MDIPQKANTDNGAVTLATTLGYRANHQLLQVRDELGAITKF
jgi:hypothetical protein